MTNDIRGNATVEQAYLKNFNTYGLWRDTLANLTIASITWENMPDTVDVLYLEKQLFYRGAVIFFATTDGLVCASGFGTSLPNLYNIPSQRVINAPNGFTATLSNQNSVICYNNLLRKPSVFEANVYAGRLADLDSTIDVNSMTQKTPFLLKANKRNELSVKNAFMEIVGNSPALAITDDNNPDAIQVLNLNVDFKGKDLRDLQRDIFSEYCLRNGISSEGTVKNERQLVGEIAANNSGAIIYQQSKIKPRKQVCDILNNSEFFKPYLTKGPVDVKFEFDIQELIKSGNLYGQQQEEGGLEDEQIYSNDKGDN